MTASLAREYFAEQGWVKLPLLDYDVADKLTAHLQKQVLAGRTQHDSQCPTSDSLRDDAKFDSVLEQLVPTMEELTGLRLSPTYCYARLYRPGEVLHRHRDRPSCEVSVTVTLGYFGNLWPIFMAGHELLIDRGHGCIYRGCELEHWRDKYDGGSWAAWQAQAFFHYVDANGPFRDWRYDKRSKLAHH